MTTGKQESESGASSLTLMLQNGFNEMMKSVHTMIPGIIESFDETTQRAKVNLANAQEQIDGKKLSFPPLVNVPVQFFRWGGFSITAPVKKDDQCAVIFSERSMELFLLQGKADTVPRDARFFELSDAFALTGLYSDTNPVPNFNNDDLEFKSDDDEIILRLKDSGKIEILNSTGSLLVIISSMMGVILAEAPASGWSAGGITSFTALKVTLDSFI